MSDEEWTTEQTEAFHAAIADLEAPADLEPRVIAAMKESKLITTRAGRGRRGLRVFAAAAGLAVVAFLAGFAVGEKDTPPQAAVPGPGGDEFVLFLRESEASAPESAEAVEQLVNEYRSWAVRMHEEGKLIGGEKLDLGGVVLQPTSGVPATRRWTPEESFLGGYFIVRAVNYEEAARIATTCPHLKYGGTIEVRRIEPT